MEVISIISYIILPATITLATICSISNDQVLKREGIAEAFVFLLFCSFMGYVNSCVGSLHWLMPIIVVTLEIVILILLFNVYKRYHTVLIVTNSVE